MIELYSGCDRCPRAHLCDAYMAQLDGSYGDAPDIEMCGRILQSMVEDSRVEYYKAWFEYIRDFDDHIY